MITIFITNEQVKWLYTSSLVTCTCEKNKSFYDTYAISFYINTSGKKKLMRASKLCCEIVLFSEVYAFQFLSFFFFTFTHENVHFFLFQIFLVINYVNPVGSWILGQYSCLDSVFILVSGNELYCFKYITLRQFELRLRMLSHCTPEPSNKKNSLKRFWPGSACFWPKMA